MLIFENVDKEIIKTDKNNNALQTTEDIIFNIY